MEGMRKSEIPSSRLRMKQATFCGCRRNAFILSESRTSLFCLRIALNLSMLNEVYKLGLMRGVLIGDLSHQDW